MGKIAEAGGRIGRRFGRNVVGFVYPDLCVVCGEVLGDWGEWLCDGCVESLEDNHRFREGCPLCSHNRKFKSCTCDVVWDHYFEKIYSFFDFDKTIQSIAHNIKYTGKKDLAKYVGCQYARYIPSEFLRDIDGIIAVPLHFIRKMDRGYNQAEYLARGIIEGINNTIPYLDKTLQRIKHTKTQTKLDKYARQKNLADAFVVKKERLFSIKNKKIILVDDVVTTGATADICTQVLLRSGVQSVRVLSLART